MPLPLFVFIVLAFVGVLIGSWFYYKWTPEGRLKDTESQLTDHQKIAQAAHTMVSIEAAESEITDTLKVIKNRHSQKINPVKYLEHPECQSVPEACKYCGHILNAEGQCVQPECYEYR